MTRINVGVDPKDLHYKHLLAEHREIVRIPNAVVSGKAKIDFDNRPMKFTLSTGHVRFFYTRLYYLKRRYEEIYAECVERGYNVTYFGNAWNNCPLGTYRDYVPIKDDLNIILERLKIRMPGHYSDDLKLHTA